MFAQAKLKPSKFCSTSSVRRNPVDQGRDFQFFKSWTRNWYNMIWRSLFSCIYSLPLLHSWDMVSITTRRPRVRLPQFSLSSVVVSPVRTPSDQESVR